MNSIQAKKISIKDYLSSIGIEPVNYNPNRGKAKYKSPIRKESKPSFYVDTINNVWYDHGTGEGGKIVDLVMKIYNTDVSGALAKLSERKLEPFSFNQQKYNSQKPQLENQNVDKITDPRLIDYLNERKIDIQIANFYLKQMNYSIKGKSYVVLSFENSFGGFEVRNKYFKGCISQKNYTLVYGKKDSQINLFEGFFDFLSALVFFKTYQLKYDTIVLNSLNNLNKAFTECKKYSKINLFLDNDDPGLKSASRCRSNFGNVINVSQLLYPDYKDFNEFLINQKQL